MKQPNLYFNNYYPFYTQTKRGKKSYYYNITTVMHLSPEKGIVVKLDYDHKKISAIKLEKVKDRKELYKLQEDAQHISYVDFSKIIKTLSFQLRKSLNTLSLSKGYYKQIVFSSLFKHNNSIELEFEYNTIQLNYGEYDYKIRDGKKIKTEKLEGVISNEEDSLLNSVGKFLDAYESHIKYSEIEKVDFDKKINNYWDNFLPYFEPPKFIRKKEYKL